VKKHGHSYLADALEYVKSEKASRLEKHKKTCKKADDKLAELEKQMASLGFALVAKYH